MFYSPSPILERDIIDKEEKEEKIVYGERKKLPGMLLLRCVCGVHTRFQEV